MRFYLKSSFLTEYVTQKNTICNNVYKYTIKMRNVLSDLLFYQIVVFSFVETFFRLLRVQQIRALKASIANYRTHHEIHVAYK